ncbi:uncharacterized protein LOC125676291 isoform X2 [Ostrea edulis]|uniref:uncharacterized protein LOC125676291 isoform X2 n=1 Tax=Ostrea edulis TaxID=37623 RepID=UPI0024AF874E|nr:uncharacterized protein LOC125676291 isoform X2 [Ostrea edulis]
MECCSTHHEDSEIKDVGLKNVSLPYDRRTVQPSNGGKVGNEKIEIPDLSISSPSNGGKMETEEIEIPYVSQSSASNRGKVENEEVEIPDVSISSANTRGKVENEEVEIPDVSTSSHHPKDQCKLKWASSQQLQQQFAMKISKKGTSFTLMMSYPLDPTTLQVTEKIQELLQNVGLG